MSGTNPKSTIDNNSYEIIRNRLQVQSKILSERLALLNKNRKEIFNTEQFELISNQRISTEQNGVARGMIAIGDICLFAYNVHFGLKEEIALEDVFSLYRFNGQHFELAENTAIADPQFIIDFKNLYKYYRDAIFSKFYKTEHYLYMVFQTSKNLEDRKAFKWIFNNNTLKYIDDRSIHEVKQSPQHSFTFTKTSLEDRRLGKYPHISILDKVFIEAIHGDITFKIEDNTSTGLGIFSEPVNNKDQQLDDANYYFADLGNIIAIKIQPYQEGYRTYIYNVRTKQVHNIPSLLESGITLPDQQGIIFSNGYYLQTGEYKLYNNDIDNLEFMRTITSPNGEDYLYIYYQKRTNTYVLMSYNVIQQQVETPIICNGFTIFNDGKLIYFNAEIEATRHHQVQIWQTPYTATLIENESLKENVVYKIGNKNIVQAMAEGHAIIQLLNKEDSYEGLYVDLVKLSTTMLDSYFWIHDKNTHNLATPLKEIQTIAETAIDEFAKVQSQRQYALQQESSMQQSIHVLTLTIKNATYENIESLIQQLYIVRQAQGKVKALKDVKYHNEAAIESMLQLLKGHNNSLSQDTVQFLLQEEALAIYEKAIQDQKNNIATVSKVTEAQQVAQQCADIASQLTLLMEVVNSLNIDDVTHKTKIIENISVLFSALNEVRSAIDTTIKTLRNTESIGAFHAQMTLLEQSMANYLSLSETLALCDEYYSKISVHIEELESKFADHENFIIKIAEKREQAVQAFDSKKENLITLRNKRINNVEQIGLRVINSITAKAKTLKTSEEIYSFFLSDIMVEKIHQLAQELKSLEDIGKAEHLTNSLKLVQERALQHLKDKAELYVDGENIIALGPYKFEVNKQKLHLTIIQQQQELKYHLLGTGFYSTINENAFAPYKSVWQQEYLAENNEVYKAEYLAYLAYTAYCNTSENFNLTSVINTLLEADYSSGYIKGVHNEDAILIAQHLIKLHIALGPLQYPINIRVAAQLFWKQLSLEDEKKLVQAIQSVYHLEKIFSTSLKDSQSYRTLHHVIAQNNSTVNELEIEAMAHYLIMEIKKGSYFSYSAYAQKLKKEFSQYLQKHQQEDHYKQEIQQEYFSLIEQHALIQDWLKAFVPHSSLPKIFFHYVAEAACFLQFNNYRLDEAIVEDTYLIKGLKGHHRIIEASNYQLQYHNFIQKLESFETTTVPLYRTFQEQKRQHVALYEKQLRIKGMQAQPISSFMRNKLIHQVYLPMIGSNFAKQLGTADDNHRTARMGMLLLISPPGYGKTTLMEYLAATMGLHFVKINGPTIGHKITSLDPNETPISSAKAELEKINLGFEMGDNVMLYIDDIQHCSPEFLQQFISLADGQRKVDGIFEGQSKTYDLREKRFCLVMAANPYTESGQQFKIPDMLANRADVYNLGDVTSASNSLFELSFLENAIYENEYLKAFTQKNKEDFYKLVEHLQHAEDTIPEFEGNHTPAEIQDTSIVLRNLILIRNTILQVNALYIKSAHTQDVYRKEPAFKLQGSYRNMNKIASKVSPLLTANEIKNIVLEHYEAEAQTLTVHAEANLLKLKQVMELLSTKEEERYDFIIQTFQKNNQFSGLADDDAQAKILLQLANFNAHMQQLVQTLRNKN
jgi:hypothetical protein